jgi:hypothetical protein
MKPRENKGRIDSRLRSPIVGQPLLASEPAKGELLDKLQRKPKELED